MKINKNRSLQQFLPLSEAEIRDLLHPSQANLRYFLTWFHSRQLLSTQSECPLALIPLAPNPTCLLKYVLSCEENFSFFTFRSGLSDVRINCNRFS
jgi:hypothetical protein